MGGDPADAHPAPDPQLLAPPRVPSRGKGVDGKGDTGGRKWFELPATQVRGLNKATGSGVGGAGRDNCVLGGLQTTCHTAAGSGHAECRVMLAAAVSPPVPRPCRAVPCRMPVGSFVHSAPHAALPLSATPWPTPYLRAAWTGLGHSCCSAGLDHQLYLFAEVSVTLPAVALLSWNTSYSRCPSYPKRVLPPCTCPRAPVPHSSDYGRGEAGAAVAAAEGRLRPQALLQGVQSCNCWRNTSQSTQVLTQAIAVVQGVKTVNRAGRMGRKGGQLRELWGRKASGDWCRGTGGVQGDGAGWRWLGVKSGRKACCRRGGGAWGGLGLEVGGAGCIVQQGRGRTQGGMVKGWS